MSNAARKQLAMHCENFRTKYKNEHLPSHDLYIDQAVMYQDSTSKCWFPTTITKLCKEPRSYIITSKEDALYRKTQAHLKPYQPQDKKVEDQHLLQTNHIQTVKTLNSNQKIDNLTQSRPKRDINPPIKLDL